MVVYLINKRIPLNLISAQKMKKENAKI